MGERSLDQLPREIHLPLNRCHARDRHEYGRSVRKLLPAVLVGELALPLSVSPRERQPAGPLVDDAEIEERVADPGVVALGRPHQLGEDLAGFVDPARPCEDVTVDAFDISDRRRVVGELDQRDGALGELERIRFAFVESDDGKCSQGTRREGVIAQLLS